MNLDEFVTGIINNPDVIVRLFYTHGFGGGEADYYNSCLFCGYETVHVPLADSVCEIDDIMLKHIYQNHYDKADQVIEAYKLKKAASAKGQMKLEVEE